MRIRSKHRIKCDREQVWDKLMDFNFLGGTIPGLKGLKKIGRNKYEGWIPFRGKPLGIKVKADVKATFELKKINKPRSFRLIATGTGLKSKGDFRLKRNENATIVSYQVDAPSPLGKKVKKALPKLFKAIEAKCCEG